jgi:serine/threonine protein kinase
MRLLALPELFEYIHTEAAKRRKLPKLETGESQCMIDQLLGHYRIISKIGEGGMGFVYRAHDEVLHRDVALKVLSKTPEGGDPSRDDSSRERLLHEARAASSLSHPNICTIHEVGEFHGESYIVMEMVEGRSLASMIGNAGLPVESTLRFGLQIAGALAHSHDRSVVHQDLKSANVMVTSEGLIKVLDFGLARRLPRRVLEDDETQIMSPSDSAGQIVGTPSYMAPEVLRGEPGDQRIDIWALGVILFEAASGQRPFHGRTNFETISAILHAQPASLPSHVPPGLLAIIQRCLAKDPAYRYQRAAEVRAALEAVQSGTMASPEPPPDQRGPTTTVLRGIRHIPAKEGDILLLVGTMKGAFILRSNSRRNRWDVAGPYFHGQAINALAYDARDGRHRLWASTNSFWGTFLRASDDFGKTWTNPQETQIKFPVDSGAALKNVWQICLGRSDERNVLYCGVEPAALFESRDSGETWSIVRGLYDHPHRPRWMPGGGGLALHTILLDPMNKQRMHVAISSGGVYTTEDGGSTWDARNRGIRVQHLPERYPEFGQCVHKMVLHALQPDRLFLQHHWGIYRSDDAAENWRPISNGLPSDFGFAMAMHPRDPDLVYIVPVESDEFRCTPEGRLRVYRTRNGGASWEALARGLPQKGAYETILRDGMAADTLDPAGIYFGTRSGNLYGSADEGKTWKRILEGLPAVVCVKTAMIGEPKPARKAKPPAKVRSQPPSRKTHKKASKKTSAPAGRAARSKSAPARKPNKKNSGRK